MVLIAHAADYVLLVPTVGLVVWLLVTTLRQRREDAQPGDAPPGETEPPDDERPLP